MVGVDERRARRACWIVLTEPASGRGLLEVLQVRDEDVVGAFARSDDRDEVVAEAGKTTCFGHSARKTRAPCGAVSSSARTAARFPSPHHGTSNVRFAATPDGPPDERSSK